jgi:hypothetical protein
MLLHRGLCGGRVCSIGRGLLEISGLTAGTARPVRGSLRRGAIRETIGVLSLRSSTKRNSVVLCRFRSSRSGSPSRPPECSRRVPYRYWRSRADLHGQGSPRKCSQSITRHFRTKSPFPCIPCSERLPSACPIQPRP